MGAGEIQIQGIRMMGRGMMGLNVNVWPIQLESCKEILFDPHPHSQSMQTGFQSLMKPSCRQETRKKNQEDDIATVKPGMLI
jgi:hypothetical protein